MPNPKRAFLLLVLASTLALAGCASRWVVDSDVRSFSSLPADAVAGSGATYRFERLPSQQQDERAARQADSLEALAAPALAAAGLSRNDAAARYSVQLGARVGLTFSPWDDPWLGPWGFGGGWYGASTPWYSREVSVVLRELASNRVVYETRARNDGPYSSDAPVLGTMFKAALQGFPVPPQGERRVDIEIAPRASN
jgi:hypothetical protein